MDREGSDPLGQPKALTMQELGRDARLFGAQTKGGTYSGVLLGETEQHFVQRLSARSAVAHPKHLFTGSMPRPGDNVSISYRDDKAQIRPVPVRANVKGLGR